jgi:hypothetical protein
VRPADSDAELDDHLEHVGRFVRYDSGLMTVLREKDREGSGGKIEKG